MQRSHRRDRVQECCRISAIRPWRQAPPCLRRCRSEYYSAIQAGLFIDRGSLAVATPISPDAGLRRPHCRSRASRRALLAAAFRHRPRVSAGTTGPAQVTLSAPAERRHIHVSGLPACRAGLARQAFRIVRWEGRLGVRAHGVKGISSGDGDVWVDQVADETTHVVV